MMWRRGRGCVVLAVIIDQTSTRRPSVADWGGGISVVLHCGSNCPLSQMDGRIMRRGIISSCQSAATSEIVKRCCSSLCKQRYSKYSDLYLLPLPFTANAANIIGESILR